MKKYLLIATAFVALASCSDDTFVGESNSPNTNDNYGGAINFGLSMQKMTRGDIGGKAAADLLGNNFYVTGTKADMTQSPAIPTSTPTTTLVFDNYLVHYGVNTAGTTTSNTANWEYVGINQTTPTVADHVRLSSTTGAQTIKFWDYSAAQYDFFGFSTGKQKAVKDKTIATIANDEINVTAMNYGAALASSAKAYTFIIPTVNALKEAYITDIVKVEKGTDGANYGKEVQLKFKNLGSKVRVALYETVPGYSVKDVTFYTVDGTTDFSGSKSTTAALISAANGGIPTKGTIEVYFPHVGSNNASKADYNKASATVTPITITDPTNPSDPSFAFYDKAPTFGTLAATKLVAKERDEAGVDNVFLGRSLPAATYAGDKDAMFYTTVFPVSSSSPLTLRVDYTLVLVDGAAETIVVKGAKAVVPANYTKWLPNYAYTYIFKISDNTNGWTGTGSENAGLYPITFDAVVAEATEATGEQKTITTVATPSITTYQQNHDITKEEYSKGTGKNIYVQVMDNSAVPANLVTTLNGNTPEGKDKSLLYAVDASHAATATEALVMDALQKRTAEYAGDAATVTGRNGITLTKTTIDNTVTKILNGVDDNPIELTDAGKAAMITITGTGAVNAGTYAYVYDYTTVESPATKRAEIIEYQPISVVVNSTVVDGKYHITTTTLNSTSDVTADDEAVNNAYIYFSKTTDGTNFTYSYISVTGKTNLPAGLVKVLKSSLTTVSGTDVKAAANTFYFDRYFTNDGKYAVKIIKIVD